jgi:hypothetical protein
MLWNTRPMPLQRATARHARDAQGNRLHFSPLLPAGAYCSPLARLPAAPLLSPYVVASCCTCGAAARFAVPFGCSCHRGPFVNAAGGVLACVNHQHKRWHHPATRVQLGSPRRAMHGSLQCMASYNAWQLTMAAPCAACAQAAALARLAQCMAAQCTQTSQGQAPAHLPATFWPPASGRCHLRAITPSCMEAGTCSHEEPSEAHTHGGTVRALSCAAWQHAHLHEGASSVAEDCLLHLRLEVSVVGGVARLQAPLSHLAP